MKLSLRVSTSSQIVVLTAFSAGYQMADLQKAWLPTLKACGCVCTNQASASDEVEDRHNKSKDSVPFRPRKTGGYRRLMDIDDSK